MLESTAPRPVAPPFDAEPRPAPQGWEVWAALGSTVGILVFYNVLQVVVAYAVAFPAAWGDGGPASGAALAARLQASLYERFGLAVWVGLSVAVPVATAALVALARLRGDLRSELGFTWPSWKAAALGFAVTAAVVVGHAELAAWLDRPPVPEFLERAWATAGSTLALGVVVAVLVPVFEELLFRGFLQPALTRRAASPLARFVAVAAVSASWAAIHFQYDLFDLAAVFTLGLVFGMARLATGSTLLAIGLHVAVNASAMIEASRRLGPATGGPA